MKINNGLISVIVPIYKVEKYLNQCVQSLINQTYKQLEIILVDDGSPDKCGEICDKWAIKDNRIKVLHKENGGLSDARNVGLSIATGEFIAFVDSDDWVEAEMYETMINILLEEKADFCACGIVDTYQTKEVFHVFPFYSGKSEEFLLKIYKDNIFPVSACNKLFRKECWNEIRFPVGKLCEDAFTTYLLLDQAKRVVQISDTFYHYCIRKDSIMTTAFRPARMDEEEAWRCNYEYMEKNHPNIKRYAFDFYLQKVNMLLHTIGREQKEEFRKEYEYLDSIIKNNVFYILFFSKLSLKYRIRFVADFIKLNARKR